MSNSSIPIASPPIYFNAGPCPFPDSVLKQAQSSILELDSNSPSILTLSHRSKQFDAILDQTEALLASLLHLPPTHTCIFVQGGASLQFAMVPLHFLHRSKDPIQAQYYITGTWSKKAMQEAEKLGVHVQRLQLNSTFPHIHPDPSAHTSPSVTYTYFCSNETIDGIEWDGPKEYQGKLIADMSSNFLSKPIPHVERFDLIFAGAQKNLGPAGVTLVILKKELLQVPLVLTKANLPTMLDYSTYVSSRSLYNTPPVFAMYVCFLMLQWLKDQGGLAMMESTNQNKATLLYTALDQSQSMWPLINDELQSRMNVVFRIGNKSEKKPNPNLEKTFLEVAERHGFRGLEGHRSVGGLRASLYNAITLEQVQQLVTFIHWFDKSHS